MPVEIEFSVLSDPLELFQSLMRTFERETGIRVRLRRMNWGRAWDELVRSAIYGEGPDVSEIGTTWTGDLISLNALRPFSTTQLAGLGWSRAFLPVSWKNANPSTELTWTIPWFAAPRMVYYRRALLEQFGIDPQAAFATPAAVDHTVTCLKERGVRLPLLLQTGGTIATIHTIASWIWAEGGEYVTPDGHQMALDTPQAMRGIHAFYALGRCIATEVPLVEPGAPERAFALNKDAGVLFSGTWLVNRLPDLRSETYHEVGVAHMPGPTFVGGSNLVVWKYSRQAEAAYELVRFLTRTDIQMQLAPQAGLLPARAETLDAPPYTNHPFWRTAAESLRGGRTFPTIRLWGIIEDRLALGLNEVWSDIFAHPERSVDEILAARIPALCQRLNLVLQER